MTANDLAYGLALAVFFGAAVSLVAALLRG